MYVCWGRDTSTSLVCLIHFGQFPYIVTSSWHSPCWVPEEHLHTLHLTRRRNQHYQMKRIEKILFTLRIMGCQNCWFGNPRTLLYRVKPLFLGGSQLILRVRVVQSSQAFPVSSYNFKIVRVDEFGPFNQQVAVKEHKPIGDKIRIETIPTKKKSGWKLKRYTPSAKIVILFGGIFIALLICISRVGGITHTLPKTNVDPKNKPSQMESSLSTTIFGGLCLFQGV